jgi:N-acetylmuramoyl-L-alanine amidase
VINLIEIKENYIPVGTTHITTKGNSVIIRKGKTIFPTSLTIHSTANLDSTALNERNWLANPSNKSDSSWNICVDENEAIIAIPLDERSNHSGSDLGNNTSIGLEICESGNREQTLQNAIEVSAFIMAQYNLDTIKQHYDWNRKNCPRILRETNRWEWFKNEVLKKLEELRTLEFKEGQGKEALAYLIQKGKISNGDKWFKAMELIPDFEWWPIKFANEVAKNKV